MKLKNINKRMFIVAGIALVIILVIIIITYIISLQPKSFSTIEQKMRKAAISYYSDNEDLLPQTVNEKVTVGLSTLEDKYMTKVQDMVKEGVICNGEVRVIKSDAGYLYIPYLNCGDDYATAELSEIITGTTVESGNGLYINGDGYVFKGDKVDNYVSFAGKTWRIVNIDANGNLKLIETAKRDSTVWDDRYNEDKGYNIGFNDFSVSRMNDTLEEIYKREFSDDKKAYIVSTNLCIGKRAEDSKVNDGSIECSAKSDLEQIGLLQANEYVMASTDENCQTITDESCQNYNYLNDYERVFWTITPVKDTTYRIYKITTSGGEYANASSYAVPRITLYINGNVIYKSGNGTSDSPYVI
ncbi:MAG: hypothetical protein PHE54_02345 [Bacilli bacterium]|nr:hypothetical protein [Bacilli bacterium]